MNIPRAIFTVTAASFAGASLVTLHVTFSDVFSVPLDQGLRQGIDSISQSSTGSCAVNLFTVGVFLIVVFLGGCMGYLTYNIFQKFTSRMRR